MDTCIFCILYSIRVTLYCRTICTEIEMNFHGDEGAKRFKISRLLAAAFTRVSVYVVSVYTLHSVQYAYFLNCRHKIVGHSSAFNGSIVHFA